MQQSDQIILLVCSAALLAQAAVTFRWGASRGLKIYVLGFPLLAVASVLLSFLEPLRVGGPPLAFLGYGLWLAAMLCFAWFIVGLLGVMAGALTKSVWRLFRSDRDASSAK